jgi:hypothetical protein
VPSCTHSCRAIDFIRNKVFVRFSAAVYGSLLEGCAGHTMLP